MKIVIAQSWQAFEWYCKSQGIDSGDRAKAIPLITFSDKYRLNRRVCRSVSIIKVGTIDPTTLKTFVRELAKYGVEAQL